MSAFKKIRLEQKAMPVSSEEELSLITLREQNHRLTNNYLHREKIEQDLRKKIQHLEDTLKLCEDKDPEHRLSIINESLRDQIENLEAELNKSRLSERRLTDYLQNKQENAQKSASVETVPEDSPEGGDKSKKEDSADREEFDLKLAEINDLAEYRLKELRDLHEEHNNALELIGKLKEEKKNLPKEVITDSDEYRTLQSQFNVLYNDATQLKTQLIDLKKHVVQIKDSHERQIERMADESQKIQKELSDKILELEKQTYNLKKGLDETEFENEGLRKSNQEIVKLDAELKKSLNGYKSQVQQKNNEISRLRTLLDDSKKNISSINNTTVNDSSSPSNKGLKDIINALQKQLDKTKNEEEALMQDLDVTGQAYEDMQDQNHRLLQQLEEKDEAQFKLMTDYMKATQLQASLTEEKAVLKKELEIFSDMRMAHSHEIKLHLEKIKLLQENVSTLEKELETRETLVEQCKLENQDVKRRLSKIEMERDKILANSEQLQRSFTDKTNQSQIESFRIKRLNEELDVLKKKYERVTKMQSATAPDEVLMEEIREYKEQLTCPSCKTKPKDAVLTKCFHVFCFDCLKTRVDTRQRKCPKCNAQFGANDFHRLYLV